MKVKANVRQRRQERIKTIQSYRPELIGNGESEQKPPILPSNERDERWEDPEYVWKLKERQLFQTPNNGQASREKDDSGFHTTKSPTLKRFTVKLLISGLGFLLLWGLFQAQHPVAEKARSWVSRSLTEDIQFASLAAWYETKFGGPPSFLPAFRDKKGQEAQKVHSGSLGHFTVPVKGSIIEPFSERHPWVEIETAGEAPVLGMAAGLVSFSGYLEDTGYTIVVQHAGGLYSVYGYLKENRWQENDWIESGEIIGHTQLKTEKWAKKLYFAVKKDDEPVDPAEVVSFD